MHSIEAVLTYAHLDVLSLTGKVWVGWPGGRVSNSVRAKLGALHQRHPLGESWGPRTALKCLVRTGEARRGWHPAALLPPHLGPGLFLPRARGTVSLAGHVSTGLQSDRQQLFMDAFDWAWLFLSPQRCCAGWASIWPFRELGKYLKECWSGLLKFHTHFVSLLEEGLSTGFLFFFWFIQFTSLGCGTFFLCLPHRPCCIR